MKYSNFSLTTLFVTFTILALFISPVVRAGDDDDNEDRQDGQYPCGSPVCQQCDSSLTYCVKCDRDYYLNTYTGNCEDRSTTRDRGDGMSKAVAIINIIFIIALVHIWLFISRNNRKSFITSSGNRSINNTNGQELQANQPNQLNQQPDIGLIRIGAPSEGGSSYDLRSRFSSVSHSPQPLAADFQKPAAKINLEQPTIGGQDLQAQEFPVNLQQQQGQQQQQAYPNIQMGYPVGQNYPMIQQPQQQQQQTTQQQQPQQAFSEGPQYTSRDLNGYWLTQAGKFSFVGLSNFHRIKHVVLNIMMLEQLMAMLLYESGRRGDDNDDDSRKKLLFLGYSLIMLVYWVYTLLPPFVIKLFSYCLCLKTDSWGRISTIFINFLFYLSSLLILISLTWRLQRLDGFESQVWILLVLAGFLLIVFFDKKSVEIAKKNKGGYFERLIKFRKMDFLEPQRQEQQQQQQLAGQV